MSTEMNTRSSFFLLRDKIEREIAKSILSFGEKNKLRDACEYALLSGGKRLRPIIVMMVAEAIGNGLNVVPAALAVEFFQTASLVADDLPCMDDDAVRRDKPSVHKVYGESIALLASYSLIFAGYEKVCENGEEMRAFGHPFAEQADSVSSLAIRCSSRAAGISGATGGQFLDLHPPYYSLEMVKEVVYKKTVTLFEVAFTLGWLFGGGGIEKLEEVKQAAYHFGMAFQIADDLEDFSKDEKGGAEMNMARFLGGDRAFGMLQKEIESFRKSLIDLSIDTPSFQKMIEILYRSASTALHSIP